MGQRRWFLLRVSLGGEEFESKNIFGIVSRILGLSDIKFDQQFNHCGYSSSENVYLGCREVTFRCHLTEKEAKIAEENCRVVAIYEDFSDGSHKLLCK